jgi:hypothetical protein
MLLKEISPKETGNASLNVKDLLPIILLLSILIVMSEVKPKPESASESSLYPVKSFALPDFLIQSYIAFQFSRFSSTLNLTVRGEYCTVDEYGIGVKGVGWKTTFCCSPGISIVWEKYSRWGILRIRVLKPN